MESISNGFGNFFKAFYCPIFFGLQFLFECRLEKVFGCLQALHGIGPKCVDFGKFCIQYFDNTLLFGNIICDENISFAIVSKIDVWNCSSLIVTCQIEAL